MPGLQEWIHRLEEGGGAKITRAMAGILAFVALALIFHLREFQHFREPRAMDTAQVARNLAEGKGFTTDLVRPLSLHLLQKKQGGEKFPLKGPHPDLANAPAWPFLIAHTLRSGGLNDPIPKLSEFDKENPVHEWRHGPEVRIAVLGEALFLLALGLVFLLARRLFDGFVAWISVILLAGAEVLWQFAWSGLPAMLSIVLLLAVAHLLSLAERGAREEEWGAGRLLPLLLCAGAAAGLLMLTQYALAVVMIPLLGFVLLGFEQRRAVLVLAVILGFAAVSTPWLVRNYELSGGAFGTAGFALQKNSRHFPADRLDRTLQPVQLDSPHDLGKMSPADHLRKFWDRLPAILRNDLPRMGGSWITALFLAGLLVPFQRPGNRLLRWFVLAAIACLVVVQAFGASSPGEPSETVRAGNLLIVLAPFVVIFGVGMLSLLIGQIAEDQGPRRWGIAGAVCAVFCAPLLLNLMTPSRTTLSYPPYHPPVIAETGEWFEEPDLLLSDVPWAVAWYGKQRCIWLPWSIDEDFTALHNQQPVNGLYLTSRTMDRKLVSELWRGEQQVWGRFVANAVVNEEVPEGFPLRHAFIEWFPDQLLLADRPRWIEAEGAPGEKAAR